MNTLDELDTKDNFEIPKAEGQAVTIDYFLFDAAASSDETVHGVVTEIGADYFTVNPEGENKVEMTVTTARHGVKIRTKNENLGGVKSITLGRQSSVNIG